MSDSDLVLRSPNPKKFKCKKCNFVADAIGLSFFGKYLTDLGLKRDYCLACWVRALDQLGIGQVEEMKDE